MREKKTYLPATPSHHHIGQVSCVQLTCPRSLPGLILQGGQCPSRQHLVNLPLHPLLRLGVVGQVEENPSEHVSSGLGPSVEQVKDEETQVPVCRF